MPLGRGAPHGVLAGSLVHCPGTLNICTGVHMPNIEHDRRMLDGSPFGQNPGERKITKKIIGGEGGNPGWEVRELGGVGCGAFFFCGGERGGGVGGGVGGVVGGF